MKAVYENDTAKGQGYGRVRLSDLPSDADVAASGWNYALLRASDQKSLHPTGWEDTACRLTPDAVHTAGGEMLLDIDPAVVCQLDELNTYRLMVYPPAGNTLKAVLELSGIVYPAEHASGGISVPAKPVAKPVPESAPQPKPEVPAEPLSLTPPPSPDIRPAAGGAVRVLVVVLFLLIAGGAGAWYLLKQEMTPEQAIAEATPEMPAEKPAETPETPTPETRTETPAPAEDPKPADPPKAEATPATPPAPATLATPPAPVPAAPSVPIAPLEQARQFLRGSGAPADGLALSRTLPETSDGRDAAFLLLEAAAEQGMPDAMLDLGAFYDPSRALARGSIQPDPEQAWLWYDKAAAAGQAEATSRRQALRVWLEAEAAKGVATAKDLLSRIQ